MFIPGSRIVLSVASLAGLFALAGPTYVAPLLRPPSRAVASVPASQAIDSFSGTVTKPNYSPLVEALASSEVRGCILAGKNPNLDATKLESLLKALSESSSLLANSSGFQSTDETKRMGAGGLSQNSSETFPFSLNPVRGTSISVAQSGNGVARGGGDLISISFLAHAQAFLKDLHELHSRSLFPQISENALIQAISDYRVDVVNSPIFDSFGVERTAVTDLAKKTITLNSSKWLSSQPNREQVATLVVHEYLRASGYSNQDDRYEWSKAIIEELKKLPRSYLFLVSTSDLDAYLFQKRLTEVNRTAGMACRSTVNTYVSFSNLSFRTSAYGVEIYFPRSNSGQPYFSSMNRNLLQVSFGESQSLFVLSANEASTNTSTISLVLETPKMGANSLKGSVTWIESSIPKVLAIDCAFGGVDGHDGSSSTSHSD